MVLLKRFVLAVLVLALAAPIVHAGANEGGVLVVHSSSLAYTSDTASYSGLSGVACGQDGPEPPFLPECPPYDPYDGANPCVSTAANPTSAVTDGSAQVWYVLAAFHESDTVCPRLKAAIFGIEYDETQLSLVAWGPTTEVPLLELGMNDWEDGSEWPTNRSGVALSLTVVRTSKLQELYWFAGYAYGPATFSVVPTHPPQQPTGFADDSNPPLEDTPFGYGVLGFRGTAGTNPAPEIPSPIEETSWGKVKANYR